MQLLLLLQPCWSVYVVRQSETQMDESLSHMHPVVAMQVAFAVLRPPACQAWNAMRPQDSIHVELVYAHWQSPSALQSADVEYLKPQDVSQYWVVGDVAPR
jgi:hypothetical protein